MYMHMCTHIYTPTYIHKHTRLFFLISEWTVVVKFIKPVSTRHTSGSHQNLSGNFRLKWHQDLSTDFDRIETYCSDVITFSDLAAEFVLRCSSEQMASEAEFKLLTLFSHSTRSTSGKWTWMQRKIKWVPHAIRFGILQHMQNIPLCLEQALE